MDDNSHNIKGTVDEEIWDVIYYVIVCLALFGVSGVLAEKKLSV